MNMKVLHPSRKNIVPGDTFCLQIIDGRFHFGRVIRTDASIGGWPNVILVYIYRSTSTKKEEIPLLARTDLLVPPFGTNKQPWLKGYFETLTNSSLSERDVLPIHCFKSRARGTYHDADGRRIDSPIIPCGDFALEGFGSIDNMLSDALNIARTPDQH